MLIKTGENTSYEALIMRLSPASGHPHSVERFSLLLKHPLCSSLNTRDRVSHHYKIKGEIIIVQIPIFTILDSKGKYRILWIER
jgi:hypothetical protein